MTEALMFIVKTVFDIICFLFLARLILQASRADFYNPISQGIVKATDPLLRPLRLIIPGFRNIDFAAFIAALLVKALSLVILLSLSGSELQVGALPILIRSLYDVLWLLLTIYFFAILFVIVLSFIAPGSYHPAAILLVQITDPVLSPARRILPPLGGLDFSPIIVFMAIILVRDFLLPGLLLG